MIDVRGALPKGCFLARWLDYAEPYEYPDSFAAFSLLACASAAVEGRLTVNPGTEPSPKPNLFVVLYGPSGSRKSTAVRHAVDLLGAARPDCPVLPSSFTREALIGYLSRESEQSEEVAGLIVTEELADLIGGADYCLQTTKFLTQMWDCRPVWVNETRAHGREVIRNAYVSLLGASAPDWLEGIEASTLAGGFLRRLLLVVEPGPKRENPRPVHAGPLFDALVRDFSRAFGEAAVPRGVSMRLSQGAERRMREWYSEVSEWRAGLAEKEGHFANTVHTHVLKVAALVHLLDGGAYHTLEEESLDMGIGLVEALIPGTFQAYAALVPTPFARIRAAIVRIVAEAKQPLNDGDVENAVVAARGVKPKEATEAKVTLLNDGTLRRTKDGRIEVNRR